MYNSWPSFIITAPSRLNITLKPLSVIFETDILNLEHTLPPLGWFWMHSPFHVCWCWHCLVVVRQAWRFTYSLSFLEIVSICTHVRSAATIQSPVIFAVSFHRVEHRLLFCHYIVILLLRSAISCKMAGFAAIVTFHGLLVVSLCCYLFTLKVSGDGSSSLVLSAHWNVS